MKKFFTRLMLAFSLILCIGVFAGCDYRSTYNGEIILPNTPTPEDTTPPKTEDKNTDDKTSPEQDPTIDDNQVVDEELNDLKNLLAKALQDSTFFNSDSIVSGTRIENGFEFVAISNNKNLSFEDVALITVLVQSALQNKNLKANIERQDNILIINIK